jgi:uroporphyrinogen decarboxylase
MSLVRRDLNHLTGLGLLRRTCGMPISPEQWRWAIKPRLAELIATMKKQAPVKYFHHTCGGVVPIIEELAEIGVDILNPIQPLAASMGAENLKKRFGDIICLHGGVDEQHVLPKGTPEEVAKHVREQMAILAQEGGYIVGPAHNIQADVPPENIMALYDSVLEYGRYPIQAQV